MKKVVLLDDYRSPPAAESIGWLEIHLLKTDASVFNVVEITVLVDCGGSYIFAPIAIIERIGDKGERNVFYYEYDSQTDRFFLTVTEVYDFGDDAPGYGYAERELLDFYSKQGEASLRFASISNTDASR